MARQTPSDRRRARFFRLIQWPIHDPKACWEWQGARTAQGYGHYCHTSAHRMAWLLLVGPVAEGDHVHHACGNRKCVRLDHLRVVSPRQHGSAHRAMRRREAAKQP